MSTPQDPFARPPESGGGSTPQQGGWTAPPGWGQRQGQPAWGQPQAGAQQPGWGQPPAWGQPGGRPPFGTPAGPPRNGPGTAAVVLGALSIPAALTVLGGLLLGLGAVLLGVQGRRRARSGEATNGGAATAGTVLGVLGLLASVAAVAVWASLLRSDSGQDLVDCLEAAADQAAVEQCQRQFEDDLIG